MNNCVVLISEQVLESDMIQGRAVVFFFYVNITAIYVILGQLVVVLYHVSSQPRDDITMREGAVFAMRQKRSMLRTHSESSSTRR